MQAIMLSTLTRRGRKKGGRQRRDHTNTRVPTCNEKIFEDEKDLEVSGATNSWGNLKAEGGIVRRGKKVGMGKKRKRIKVRESLWQKREEKKETTIRKCLTVRKRRVAHARLGKKGKTCRKSIRDKRTCEPPSRSRRERMGGSATQPFCQNHATKKVWGGRAKRGIPGRSCDG